MTFQTASNRKYKYKFDITMTNAGPFYMFPGLRQSVRGSIYQSVRLILRFHPAHKNGYIHLWWHIYGTLDADQSGPWVKLACILTLIMSVLSWQVLQFHSALLQQCLFIPHPCWGHSCCCCCTYELCTLCTSSFLTYIGVSRQAESLIRDNNISLPFKSSSNPRSSPGLPNQRRHVRVEGDLP